MDQEAIRPFRALVLDAASTVEQAEILTRRLNCTSAIWQSLSPPMTAAPWRGLAAVRIVAYLARRGAVEVAEVAREAVRVRNFASNLRCTVALRRCEPSLLAAAKTLRTPCAQAWANALTSMQRDTITMEEEPLGRSVESMEEGADGATVSRSHSHTSEHSWTTLSSSESEDASELWEDDWEAIMAAEAALSSTIALALVEGLKCCTVVDTLCETIRAQRGDATSTLADRPSEDEAGSSSDCDEHSLYQPDSPRDLEDQANATHLLAGASGAVGGCARRLLREVQRGIALVHAALDGFGIPGEHGHTLPMDASAEPQRISIDGVCPADR